MSAGSGRIPCVDIIYIMRNKRGTLSGVNRPRHTARTRTVAASRFREVRQNCCLSVPEAAKLFRVTVRTLQNWESGRVRIPYTAFKLMRILRGQELAHPAWRGFSVVGDTLWTPEGHGFRPDHMVWWSLTCRMADAFRSLVARQAPVVVSNPAGATPALIDGTYLSRTFSPVGTGEKGQADSEGQWARVVTRAKRGAA